MASSTSCIFCCRTMQSGIDRWAGVLPAFSNHGTPRPVIACLLARPFPVLLHYPPDLFLGQSSSGRAPVESARKFPTTPRSCWVFSRLSCSGESDVGAPANQSLTRRPVSLPFQSASGARRIPFHPPADAGCSSLAECRVRDGFSSGNPKLVYISPIIRYALTLK